MNYGNCDINGKVKVFLNEKMISNSSANTNKIIEFNFKNGDVLKIQEHAAIVKFNSFQTISCQKCN